MSSINNTDNKPPMAILSLGFRPFFLGAGLFAFSSMLVWMAVYAFNFDAGLNYLPSLQWHAHEMIYGYAMAVIAGFLLTAITNWTGLQTLTGYRLLLLFAFWASARLIPFIPMDNGLAIMFILDSLFAMFLLFAISKPVFKARQWEQAGILAKIALLLLANVIFYLGAMGKLEHGVRWGNYAGLYLILALLLMMARRVIPFFIEKACALKTPLKNWRWLDISSLSIFLCFMISDIINPSDLLTTLLALGLAVLHSLRLYLWYRVEIWSRPLLWVLYIAYSFITLGFVIKVAVYFLDLSPYLALHAFALGGIGVMTIGMMARVSLGHTGRNVNAPSPLLMWIFLLLVAAAVVRVIVPMIDTRHYSLWVMISQLLWTGAFTGFIGIHLPVLLRKNLSTDQ
jgi:uncharacterized protein involved in response to NO